MTVAVQQGPAKKDPMDQLQQALGIATSIYGVALDKQKTNAILEQNKLDRQKADSRYAVEQEQKTAADTYQKNKDELTFNEKFITLPPDKKDPEAFLFKKPDGTTSLVIPRATLKDRADRADAAKKDATAKAPTADDKTYALHGKAMEFSNNILIPLESDPELNITGIGAGAQKTLFPERFKSAKLKSYEQAKRSFIAGVLRKQSGATISPTEFAEKDKEYFPQAGDQPDLIAQKQAGRQIAIESFKTSSGGAWDKVTLPTIATSKKEAGGFGEAAAQTSNFPRQVRNPKTNQIAFVSTEAELKEAMAEGFQ
jgi:hypothetical protein